MRRARLRAPPYRPGLHPGHHKEPSVPTFDMAICASLVRELTAISVAAAQAIRRSNWERDGVRIKGDASPVTAADEAAEAVIADGLARLEPVLPVISEERAEHETPAIAGASFFLVDPLDGTREFIAGRRRIHHQYRPDLRRCADPRRHRRAGARVDLAWNRRPRRRAAGIFRTGDVAAAGHPCTLAPRAGAARHGEPLASRPANASLSRWLA